MKYLIAIVIAWPFASAANAEGDLYLAETEVHSTTHTESFRHQQAYPEPPSGEDYPGYYEEETITEELAPPTIIKQVSPTRSKVITRTKSRPSSKQSQPDGIGIAPVVVPVYGGQHNSFPRPVILDTPPPVPTHR